MNRRPHLCLTFVVASTGLGGRALAGPGRPELPRELAALPRETPLAFHVPRLGDLANQLQVMRSTATSLAARGFADAPPIALLPWLMWDLTPATERTEVPHGLALDRPAMLSLSADLDAAVVVLPLADPKAFVGWIEAMQAPSRAQIRLDAHTVAHVLGSDERWPLGCVVEARRAVCQIGAPAQGGIEPLRRHLRSRHPALGDVAGLGEAFADLTPDARWTAIVQPVALARAAARRWRVSTQRAYRFHPVAVQQDVARRSRRSEQRAVAHAGLFQAIALGVAANPSSGRVEVVARMTREGERRLDHWFPGRAAKSRIRSWVATPALFSLFIQAEPSITAAIARWAGMGVPAESLDGTFGLMTLGVDARCPQARASSPGRLDWAFFFPSAVTFGLFGREAADRVHADLDARFATGRAPSIRRRPPIRAEIGGGPVAVHVLEDVLVAGTGPMGGRAGLRRLQASSGPGLEDPQGFLQAVLDLSAIMSALEAAEIDEGHRQELQWLDRLRRRLGPMIVDLGRVRLSGAREAGGHHVRLELAFGRRQ